MWEVRLRPMMHAAQETACCGTCAGSSGCYKAFRLGTGSPRGSGSSRSGHGMWATGGSGTASPCHIRLLPPMVPPTSSRMEKPSVHGRPQARTKILGDVMFYFMVQNHCPGGFGDEMTMRRLCTGAAMLLLWSSCCSGK